MSEPLFIHCSLHGFTSDAMVVDGIVVCKRCHIFGESRARGVTFYPSHPKMPDSHREIEEQSSHTTTKAYACSCASHQQQTCAYYRMGYCTDRVHGVGSSPKVKPRLTIIKGDKP